jgi:hypothetical protein
MHTGENDHAWQHDAKQTTAIVTTRALLDINEIVAAAIPEVWFWMYKDN